MKILIVGNLANMGYELANVLNQNGIETKLLLPEFPDYTQDPKSMYPELEENGYPGWLVRFDNKNREIGCNNWKFQVIREMRKKGYDIILALTEFPIFAIFSGKPFVAISTGSDMRELIFKNSLRGVLLRLAYKKAEKVLWSEPDKLPLLEKLNITKKAIFLPIPRNSNIFPQKIDKGDLKDKFIILHPTAQDWRIKRNREFILAYDRLCAVRDDIHLIISDRGPDIIEAKKILSSGYARNKFDTIPPLPSAKLQYYYNLADLVVDQFGVGSFGMIAVEAMKCAKPVLMKLHEQLVMKCYKEVPSGIINADTEDEIVKELQKIVANKDLSIELGQKNKKWIERHLDSGILTKKYIEILENIVR
jgi:glycosyltransferase involved in cell wall biosynthesis